jgi:hypothetical protein
MEIGLVTEAADADTTAEVVEAKRRLEEIPR